MKPGSAANSNDEIGPPSAGLGLVLFVLYAVLFAAFVALNIVAPDIMSQESVAISDQRSLTLRGMNVAIVSGLGLILAAVMFVMIFMRLTRQRHR